MFIQFLCNKVAESGAGETCVTFGRDENCKQDFGLKTCVDCLGDIGVFGRIK